MIVENKYFKDIKRIWKDNHNGFITKESNELLINSDDILKIVYLENNVPAGYVAVYTKDDFCKLEDFPDKIEKNGNISYIWGNCNRQKIYGKRNCK